MVTCQGIPHKLNLLQPLAIRYSLALPNVSLRGHEQQEHYNLSAEDLVRNDCVECDDPKSGTSLCAVYPRTYIWIIVWFTIAENRDFPLLVGSIPASQPRLLAYLWSSFNTV
jgi:hypothetical protein